MRKLFPIALILCIALSWGTFFYRTYALPSEYEAALSKAKDSYNEGYYLEAQKLLDEANSLSGASVSYEADALQRDIYYNLNNTGKYTSYLQTMIKRYPDEPENYEKLVNLYESEDRVQKLVEIMPEFVSKWPENEVILAADLRLSSRYRERKLSYYNLSYVSGTRIVVQKNESEQGEGEEKLVRKFVAGKDGQSYFSGSFCDVSVSADGKSFFIKDDAGVYTLVDSSKNLIAKNEKVSFDYIGELSAEGIAPAIIEGSYQYINGKMLINAVKWDYACNFSDGYGAVRKGDKWAFITMQTLSDTTELPYSDIAINSRGYCTVGGRAVVSDASGYYLLDIESMEPVSDDRYEEIKAYESSQPVAFRKGDKWGYLSLNGQVLFDAQYEDAKSFTNGYAAVKVGGLWGYIDKNNNLVIEPKYTQAMPILSGGYGYVQDENGYWNQIIVERLYYAE